MKLTSTLTPKTHLPHNSAFYSNLYCTEQADKFPEEVSVTNRFSFPRKKMGKFRRFSSSPSTQQSPGSGTGAGIS